jgi:hypothetical protein
MGQTSGSVVDNRSAARVISILSGLLHVPVDPIQVNDRAAEMERMIGGLIEGEKIRATRN